MSNAELEAAEQAVADAARLLVRAAGAEAFGEQELREELRKLAETWLGSGLLTYPGSDAKTEDRAAEELLWKLGLRGKPDKM